jgi:hypothetical protein
MVELLKDKGFKEQKRCNCGGSANITFIKEGSPVLVKVRPSRQTYEIYVSGRIAEKGNSFTFNEAILRYV